MLKNYKQVKVSSLNSGLIVDLFETFKLESILKQVGIAKQKGHSIVELLLLFMFMILENKKSLICGLKFNNISKFKTPINDMLNNPNYKWRKLLYKVATRFIKLSNTSNENDNCIIFDDTSSSRKINERTVIDKIKICFFKYPNVKRWKAILSTDLQLSEIDVLKIYMRRWSIECVFKEIKQYFGYNQSKSSKYSAMIADLTIRYVFYNMLCYKKQQKTYPSMEQLLIEFYEELEEASLTIFFNALFTQKVKDFIDYSITYGYTSLTELRKDVDIVLRKFFESEVIIDKITEADKQNYDRIA